MVSWKSLFSAALFAGSAFALPHGKLFSLSCNLKDARLQVPANQTQLVAPKYAPHFIAIGMGTQNYTCNATSSTYAFTGAVAELFDTSCLYHTPIFNQAPELLFDAWNATTGITPQDVIATLGLFPDPLVLGQHYYVPNPFGSGISPKWDFTSSGVTAGNPNAFVVGSKIGDLLSPDPAVNIDNFMIKGVEGDLASLLFRVQNNGGQPPAHCDVGGANITVKYTAQYWFFGGNVTTKGLLSDIF